MCVYVCMLGAGHLKLWRQGMKWGVAITELPAAATAAAAANWLHAACLFCCRPIFFTASVEMTLSAWKRMPGCSGGAHREH